MLKSWNCFSIFIKQFYSLPEIFGIGHYQQFVKILPLIDSHKTNNLVSKFLVATVESERLSMISLLSEKSVALMKELDDVFCKPGKVTASFVDNNVECTLP